MQQPPIHYPYHDANFSFSATTLKPVDLRETRHTVSEKTAIHTPTSQRIIATGTASL